MKCAIKCYKKTWLKSVRRARLISVIFQLLAVVITVQECAATHSLDSLNTLIGQTKSEDEQVTLFNSLAIAYIKTDLEEAERNAQLSLALAEKISNTKAVAIANFTLGSIYLAQDNYAISLSVFERGLNLFQVLRMDLEIASCYNAMGKAFYFQGRYDNTVDYYLRALDIYEDRALHNKIAKIQNNIGLVYLEMQDLNKAFAYLNKAVVLHKNDNDLEGLSQDYHAIGQYYVEKRDYPYALEYFKKSIEIKLAIGDEMGIIKSHIAVAFVYMDMKEYAKSFESYQSSLSSAQRMQNSRMEIEALYGIGSLYLAQEKLVLAARYLSDAKIIANELGAKPWLRDLYLKLAQVYDASLQHEKAFKYLTYYNEVNKEIYSEESLKRSAQLAAQYEYEKQRKAISNLNEESVIQVLKIEYQEAQVLKQTAQRNGFILGFIFVVVIALVVYKGYNDKKGSNALLTEQNLIIEQKNKKITSSIKYAKRIQEASLPDKAGLLHLLPDSFIMFEPRDIVSGDFYWYSKVGPIILISAVDCTGHGVPGAFMSLIGNQLLIDIVNAKHILTPGEILRNLHDGIVSTLKKDEQDSLTVDGMDIAFCAFNEETLELEYSGCGRPFIWIRDNEINIERGGKFPLGLVLRKERAFETTKISLKKGDRFYIFTDGFSDQFDATGKDKISQQGLFDILLKIHQKPMSDQELYLKEYLTIFRSTKDQMDDICIIGVQV